jgi:methyltransferase (TIGR00027 family)
MPASAPESTAVRVALWRALHLLVDAPPPIFADALGLKLADPPEGWRARQDMDPQRTSSFRAAIVSRARFVEDLVLEHAARGVKQYVILGAGLDTFAQRRADVAKTMRIFEVDQSGPQAWKRERLEALGLGVPDYLKLVPVNFESARSWRDGLVAAGFDTAQPAIVVSTGVTMYITREATAATFREVAALAPGSVLAITFLVPVEQMPPAEQAAFKFAEAGARASGTPFISFYAPHELAGLAQQCGLSDVKPVAPEELAQRYFTGRSDALEPASGEQMLVAHVRARS